MRHKKTEALSDVIRSYTKDLGIDTKILEVRLVNSWEEIVGTMIARSTTSIEIRKGVLVVQLRSSVIKNELHLLREGLIQALNEKVGEKVINDISFR
ncbi:MAG: DUF721 domain-containing protein [Bacteroidales bacterium]|nr:DUF721 domain-containing protein [Bacteroidales bacterium]MCF8456157.1 DUF721 domain-containing protein [Bacteroidales bacterium]